MLALRLPPDMDARLGDLAAKAGVSKASFALEAIRTQLDELEDAYLAQRALDEGGTPIPLGEIMRKYGVDPES